MEKRRPIKKRKDNKERKEKVYKKKLKRGRKEREVKWEHTVWEQGLHSFEQKQQYPPYLLLMPKRHINKNKNNKIITYIYWIDFNQNKVPLILKEKKSDHVNRKIGGDGEWDPLLHSK